MFLEHLKSIFLEYYVCRKSLSYFSGAFKKKQQKVTTLSNLVRFTTQKSQQNDKTLNSKKKKEGWDPRLFFTSFYSN